MGDDLNGQQRGGGRRATVAPAGRPCIAIARRWIATALVAGVVAGVAPSAAAQTTSPTLWSFLGIGADQNSSNPAIQAAAKAKAAKHEICKKKKALQYLATMGCTAEHPEVGPALIAAMGDPDEPVRYEAVKAVLQTAAECQSREQKRETRKALGCVESCHDHCKKMKQQVCDFIDRLFGKAPPKERKCKEALEACHEKLHECITGQPPCVDPTKEDCPCGNGQGPCCSPEMREKLQQLAYGRDDKGCFLETSERVRTVAEQALKACAACSGEAFYGGTTVLDQAVREMPPADERELPYDAMFDQDACIIDRAVIPVPESERAQPRDAAPAAEPLGLPPPSLPTPRAAPPQDAEPVMLPAPVSFGSPTHDAPIRSVLVRDSLFSPPTPTIGPVTPSAAPPAGGVAGTSVPPNPQPTSRVAARPSAPWRATMPQPAALDGLRQRPAAARPPRWAALPGAAVRLEPPSSAVASPHPMPRGPIASAGEAAAPSRTPSLAAPTAQPSAAAPAVVAATPDSAGTRAPTAPRARLSRSGMAMMVLVMLLGIPVALWLAQPPPGARRRAAPAGPRHHGHAVRPGQRPPRFSP
jgi:hypothetical protein